MMDTGLFETMLVVHGRVLFAQEHLARMTRSALALGVPPPDPLEFHERVRAAASDAAVRCDLVEGALTASPRPISARTLARRERGRVMALDHSYVRAHPQHKLIGAYDTCIAALRQAEEAGADEALFATEDGRVLEGTATNVFAVKDRTLVTAADRVLPGITRDWVLAAASSLGIAVEYRLPAIDEVREGAFLTGSLTMLAPVRVLNGRACRAPGAIFEALAERWSTLLACVAPVSSS